VRHLLGAVLSLGLVGCSEQNPHVATRFNQDASLDGSLPWSPLEGKVITSWVDKRNSTMSTLYGNDAAARYARTTRSHDYPSGSVLSLVTWSRQDDPRWFGATIPAAPKSVEFVVVGTGLDHRPSYSYREYAGKPLKITVAQEGPAPNSRAAYLLSQRAAVMP
jgi:hypothetical protein